MKNISIIFFLVLPLLLCAQHKQLSIYDTQVGRYTLYAPDNFRDIQWVGNTTMYSYVVNKRLYVADANNLKIMLSIDVGTLDSLLTTDGGNGINGYTGHAWVSDNEVAIEGNKGVLIYDINEKLINRVFALPVAPNAYALCPNGEWLAYTYNNNVYITDYQGKVLSVTNDTANGVVNGTEVYRNEFGSGKGLFWSNNGNLLAFYHNNESMVQNYPLVAYSKVGASVHSVKYPMAGKNSQHVSVGVFNLYDSTTVFLDTGEPADKYLTNITWGPDDAYIYIQEVNREQNRMQLNRYLVESGVHDNTLFTELSPTYVEPQNPLYFLPMRKDQFIYQSRRDGFNHLYLYSENGQELKQLTIGEYEVEELLGADARNNVYFTANPVNLLDELVCKVNFSNNNLYILSKDNGIHAAVLNGRQGKLIDVFNSRLVPNTINLTDTEGTVLSTLLQSSDKLSEFALAEEKTGTIKAADGITDLYYRMFLPPDMNMSEKHPVIVYTYGGPHYQVIRNQYYNLFDLWNHYMALHGYVVFTLDNRGSSRRGMEFENATFRQFGSVEAEDQLRGIEFLLSQTFVDSSRIGVHGWSFGGFMTINLMLRYPALIKAGVAGSPVTNWQWYEVMFGERYMDTPATNPEGYLQANLVEQAANLSGKLLIIHGGMDDVVLPQHSMSFIRACIEANRQVDYFVYPTHKHNVQDTDRVHLMEKVSAYFFENL